MTATSMTVQAAGLSDFFSSDKSAAQSKFLPVDQAFQVTSSSKGTTSGTRLAINFDITPEHYVYRDQIKLTLPAGVSAAPFQFSQSPVSIDDPTYGKVAVFDQANMVATTILTSSNGQSVSDAAVTIGWQGCAKAGLCYPPEKIKTNVNIVALQQSAAGTAKNANNQASQNNSKDAIASTLPVTTQANKANALPFEAERSLVDDEVIDYALMDEGALDSEITASNTLSGADTSIVGGIASNNGALDNNNNNVTNIDSKNVVANGLEESDPFGLSTHPWLALGLLFLAGLGLA